MNYTDKIYIAGHRGLVGSAILRLLSAQGYTNLVYRTHQELDLTQQPAVNDFFAAERPDYVFLAAAKVGGIQANNIYRGDFIYQNLAIQLNVLEAARQYQVKRLVFLGSSCIYPRDCLQPMREEYLLSGPLELTNEPYAIAKIAGIKLCEAYNSQYGMDFVALMPTNLYGPHDNFDLTTSHVLPALLHKIHRAKITKEKSVLLWGTGLPKREFLYVDDLAAACIFMMAKKGYTQTLNVGSGEEVTIHQLAEMICEVIEYKGNIIYDNDKPDGTPRKLLDSTRLMQLGWKAETNLRTGLALAYKWFLINKQ